MPRAIWKGHISFGLVQIPVGLYSATQDVSLGLHLVDRRDYGAIGYRKVNKRTNQEVPEEEIVRAAESADGGQVVLEDEELAAVAPENAQRIDIEAFVDAADIDPRWFVRPYYLAPERRTARAYALLRETLRAHGRAGIARVVLRTRAYIAAILVQGDVLVLELLRYAEEVRDPGELAVPTRDLGALGVGERERKTAELLVASLEEEWDPKRWHDTWRERLEAVIEEKARTGAVHRPPPEEAPVGEPVDILRLLEQSLAALEGERKEAKPKRKKKEPAEA